MPTLDTDYLIIGAGAVGLAFADTLLAETTDAHLTIVDRHGKPGGHWNDAYSFVALHQPSAFYGVASMPLGANRKDTHGVNAGLYELASGPEVSGYFDAVMRQKLLPSGRVTYLPMSDHLGDGRVVSHLSGKEFRIAPRRKTVDATWFGTTVPSTHTPRFTADASVTLATPNDLPHLWKPGRPRASAFVVVGAGKTAMDVVNWLIGAGAEPATIHWIVPRDSWLLNRRTTQPGLDFFDPVFGGQAAQMQAFAECTSIDDIFDRLEAAGVVRRIDRNVRPTMFHYATISDGEIDELRRVTHVIRKGRVTAITSGKTTLTAGEHTFPTGALYVDCTASAVAKRPTRPIFEAAHITPQLVRVPQPAFSAALIAYVEAHYGTDDEKNSLCRPVPFPHDMSDYARTNLVNMTNQMTWMQDKALGRWIRDCRLDGFGKVVAAIDPADTAKLALLGRMRTHGPAAMANLQKLAAAGR